MWYPSSFPFRGILRKIFSNLLKQKLRGVMSASYKKSGIKFAFISLNSNGIWAEESAGNAFAFPALSHVFKRKTAYSASAGVPSSAAGVSRARIDREIFFFSSSTAMISASTS